MSRSWFRAVWDTTITVYGYCAQTVDDDIYNSTQLTIQKCESRIVNNLEFLRKAEARARGFLVDYEETNSLASKLEYDKEMQMVAIYEKNVKVYNEKLNEATRTQLKLLRTADTFQNDDVLIAIADRLKEKRSRKTDRAQSIIDAQTEDMKSEEPVQTMRERPKTTTAAKEKKMDVRPLEEFYDNHS